MMYLQDVRILANKLLSRRPGPLVMLNEAQFASNNILSLTMYITTYTTKSSTNYEINLVCVHHSVLKGIASEQEPPPAQPRLFE